MQAGRSFLAILVVVGLAAGLACVVIAGRDRPDLPATSVSSSAPVAAPGADSPVRPAAPDPASPAPAAATAPHPLRNPTGSSVIGSSAVTALREALAAWGQFAVTGRISDLGDHFVAGGPQRRQLRTEAESIRMDPPGAPPYAVTTGEVFTVSVTATDVVLRTEIQWARAGEPIQSFVWDVQMRYADGKWRLLTVEEAGGPGGGE